MVRERERERGRVERKQYSLLAILGDGRVEFLGFVFYIAAWTLLLGAGVLCGGVGRVVEGSKWRIRRIGEGVSISALAGKRRSRGEREGVGPRYGGDGGAELASVWGFGGRASGQGSAETEGCDGGFFLKKRKIATFEKEEFFSKVFSTPKLIKIMELSFLEVK